MLKDTKCKWDNRKICSRTLPFNHRLCMAYDKLETDEKLTMLKECKITTSTGKSRRIVNARVKIYIFFNN